MGKNRIKIRSFPNPLFSVEMVGIEPTSEKVIHLNVYKLSQPI
jgi:hypothetical protein